MSANKAESPEHRKLVKGLMDYLSKEGFQAICAAYEGYNQCEPMIDRVPDIMGQNARQLLAIGEAKTCDDLDNERTDDQFKVFSNRVMTSGNSNGQTVPFYIGIPNTCIEQLQNRLKVLGLDQKPNIQIIKFEI
jgi:hypothetical protein